MRQYFGVFEVTPLTMGLGLGVALTVGVLAGIIPAWQASRVQIAAALRAVGRESEAHPAFCI